MLNLRRYLSWLSVLLDKQQNNVQALSELQLTTFQHRPNLVPSRDNLIVLQKTPKCLWLARGFTSKNLSLFFSQTMPWFGVKQISEHRHAHIRRISAGRGCTPRVQQGKEASSLESSFTGRSLRQGLFP